MNMQHLSSTCGILVTLSCFVPQTGFAQSSLQIGTGGMIIHSNSTSLELSHGRQTLSSQDWRRQALKEPVFRGWQKPHSTRSTVQRTSITLSAGALRQPCQLTILAPGTNLTGYIKVDGKTVGVLKGSTSFNLSPYLSKGVRTVEITGKYSPTNAAVQVKLSAVGAQVSQQTSGNGKLNHLLAIAVR